jgi:WD40 repeat protein
LRFWPVADPTQDSLGARYEDPVTAIAYAPTGSFSAVGRNEGGIQMRDGLAGSSLFTFQGHRGAVTSLCFSPDGARLASCSPFGGVVQEWWAASGKQCVTYTLAVATCVAYSPDGAHLAASLLDGTVAVWEVPGAAAGEGA